MINGYYDRWRGVKRDIAVVGTKISTRAGAGGNMTTIEMLKELVENGGMFECDILPSFYLKKTENGSIEMNNKRNEKNFTLELNESYMAAVWKPYVKPVDWTKVPIDTKVKCKAGGRWYGRHFAGIHCGKPSVWDSGCTSHSTHDNRIAYEWDEVKLAE